MFKKLFILLKSGNYSDYNEAYILLEI